MAPQKKMTLQEFFSDQSFGGSWADDEIDMASISVPIEKHKQSLYSKDPFGSSRQSGGYGGQSYNRLSGMHDNGPPYIVKLLNLPVTSNDGFIEDLFKSRYTAFVKFKIVVDPSSNILETHVIKKVAFVELESFQEMNKVLKWQDLYYKATRRVVVELADFHDFQHCISFNQEHEREIQQIQADFVKQKQNQHLGHGGFDQGPRNVNINSPPRRYQPLNLHATPSLQPSLSDRKSSIQHDSIPPPITAPTKNKPNPFGAAKPVDVVAKQHEIDKKLITINHTTIKTLGPMADDLDLDQHGTTGKHVSPKALHVPSDGRPSQSDSRRSSVNILKRPSPSTNQSIPNTESHAEAKESEKSQLTKAPIPESIYGPKDNNKSLAELLSKSENPPPSKGRSTPKSIKNSPKPSTNKPVILKKKAQTPIDFTVKESEYISNSENATANKNVNDKPQNKELKTELKKINDAMSKSNKLENVHESRLNGSSKSKVGTPNVKCSHEVENKSNETQSISKEHEKIETQAPVSQEAERSKDRPNFKKHFAELSKRQNAQREKIQNSQNTRFNSHSQVLNNKKNNGVNHRRQNPKELGLPTEISKAASADTQATPITKNIVAKSKSSGDIGKDNRVPESKATARNKNKYNGKAEVTELPKKEVKKIQEFKSRKLQAIPKGNNLNKNGKSFKETSNFGQIDALNGTKDMKDAKESKDTKEVKDIQYAKDVKGAKDVKDVKDIKEVKDLKPDTSEKSSSETIMTNQRNSKASELIVKEVIADPSNGLILSSTGGRESIANSVSSRNTDATKPEDLSEKMSTISNRGRGRGGRGRGRGSFRGSIRGARGNRGRGNFNLHYVRSKDDKSTES